MHKVKSKERFAGVLILLAMLSGILSVAPAVDSAQYLTEAAANPNQVILGAIFQFLMALCYLGFGILLYPIIKRFDPSLSIGFLSFRIVAASLVIVGTILLISILALSQEYAKHGLQNTLNFEAIGNVLKTTRDHVNHVFMILALCAGNFMFYILLLRSKLLPQWLSVWGLIGTLLSVIASMLVSFSALEIITTEYILLNTPIALLDLILGLWLMVKGFDKQVFRGSE